MSRLWAFFLIFPKGCQQIGQFFFWGGGWVFPRILGPAHRETPLPAFADLDEALTGSRFAFLPQDWEEIFPCQMSLELRSLRARILKNKPSRLKLSILLETSISLENFSLELQNSPQKGVWCVARLTFSLWLEIWRSFFIYFQSLGP